MTSGKRVSRSTNEYRKNRAKVLAPDNGEAIVCHWCQRAPAVEADHLIEIDRGGTNDVTNLVGSCAKCNNIRGHKYQAAKKKIAKQNKPVTPKNIKISTSTGIAIILGFLSLVS